ncbi:MAG: ATP-dependent DNA helicase DinG [Spirochaetaceae bacterium]|jgi:ATP-dependent DNA helicase DinG|nr:ATP-dependent DNA helicase DinG [Spirochaetaceae bacterium]
MESTGRAGVEKIFTEDSAEKLREAISGAGGNEVFAAGFLDAGGRVESVRVLARGNGGAVPAVYGQDGDGMPDVLIHNHPEGFLSPSDNDLLIAARAAEDGIGSYIVDNSVSRVYVIAEPVSGRKRVMLDADSIIARLTEGGSIAIRLPAYENRSSQLELMRLVIRAFNEDSLAAAEAGTGVGKSFAYLLPAISFAGLNNERVVISTATITLQQQLFEKDIPLVNSALPRPVKAVLVKGRGNYLCRRRLNDMLNQNQLDLDLGGTEKEFGAVVEWASSSATGSRSDLPFMPDEGLWARVCSDADACMGMRCYAREDCFVMKQRREAADARILVVNHHLLFADLAARRDGAGYGGTVVLPPYRRVVIDEAHKTENSATSFFTGQFSAPGLFRQVARLWRRRGARTSGLIARLAALLPPAEGDGDWQTEIEDIQEAAGELNRQALELCGEESVFRLVPARDKLISARLLPSVEKTRRLLLGFAGRVAALAEEAEEKPNESAARDDLVWELRSALRRLQKMAGVCSIFVAYREHPLEAVWIERRHSVRADGGDWAQFNTAPVSIAEQLKEALFEANRTVVCVSATLTVSGNFRYWMSRSGIDRAKNPDGGTKTVLNGVFPSPFPYESVCLTAVPADAPEPNGRDFQGFVNEAVFRLAEATGGSALALFTSFESLSSAYRSAAPRLEALGIRCLRQGEDDRSRLLRAFVSDESSVLFAADSFWEGVDAPGATLRLVIMCRLPFKSPNDPLFEARSECIERRGGNPFIDLSVPEAVMRFRQGFGRLIRRADDYGAVVILDSRLLRKRYGSLFLQSLPKTRRCFESLDTVARQVSFQ